MLKDIIENAQNVVLKKDGKSLGIVDIKNEFLDLLVGSYSSPSYIYGDNTTLQNIINEGIWLEINFDDTIKYHNFTFDQLFVSIKPKYNFLTFFRVTQGNCEGKCINLVLSQKTTKFYKFLKDIGEK